ncbi:hypothetical protein [Antiquaquibacter soli]|uniref:Uncharacterized protein n=1 Tax=Antiquaquibacter soli TaxID=3064523 RepID=A0ABT9BLA0_9MICO|nr:hypothetical protein [Protaetiibacter sp. WY-16]MDO7881213.1 hypothetical protein [Protaetiibacter sp. WY-16]
MLRREAPVHTLMIALMGAALVAGSAFWMLAIAGVLIVLAVVCALLSRRAGHFGAQCLDLWAMALGMLALVVHPAAGHHGAGAPGALLYAAVVTAWAVGRVALALRSRSSWRGSAASGAVTALGFALMLALH